MQREKRKFYREQFPTDLSTGTLTVKEGHKGMLKSHASQMHVLRYDLWYMRLIFCGEWDTQLTYRDTGLQPHKRHSSAPQVKQRLTALSFLFFLCVVLQTWCSVIIIMLASVLFFKPDVALLLLYLPISPPSHPPSFLLLSCVFFSCFFLSF